VADIVTALNGLTRGVVTLLRHQERVRSTQYDLSRLARLVGMEKVVLTGARRTRRKANHQR
jgi:hypothetical protein